MKNRLLLICASLLILVVAASAAYVLYKPGFVYRVYVDGEDVGTVRTLDEYRGILAELLAREEAQAGLTLDFAQEVSAIKEFQWSPKPDSDKVQGAVTARVSYITIGWGLVVNGEPLLWTASCAEAEEILNRVTAHYVRDSSTRQLLTAEILDEVEIRSAEILPGQVVDVDSAVSFIIQGREKVDTYLVARGDSLWSIARSANISQAELRAANPSLAKNKVLKVGQTLNLVSAEPKISVRTVEAVQAYESISYATKYRYSSSLWYYQSRTVQKGVVGKREVSYEVESINGIETERKVINSRVDSQPVPKVIEKGTARGPGRGIGMFRWPLNGGRVTDRFGTYRSWLGQRHQGLDIGAAAGTTIFAASSGTVSVATYNSSYGNYVLINHSNGYSTLYAHARTLLVRTGQWVAKGEPIARVGSTGISTGPHLHFEVRRYDQPINPLQFFKP